jgi:hypothetical protein
MSAEAKDSAGQDAYRILLFAHGVSRLLVVWLRPIPTAVILAVSMGDGQYANLASILDSLIRDTDGSEDMVDAPGSIEQVVYRSDSSVLPVPLRESACLRGISIGKYMGIKRDYLDQRMYSLLCVGQARTTFQPRYRCRAWRRGMPGRGT